MAVHMMGEILQKSLNCAFQATQQQTIRTTGVPDRDFRDPIACVPILVPSAKLSSSATKSSSAPEDWYRPGKALGGRGIDERSKPDAVAAFGGAFKLSASAEDAP